MSLARARTLAAQSVESSTLSMRSPCPPREVQPSTGRAYDRGQTEVGVRELLKHVRKPIQKNLTLVVLISYW